MSVTATLQQMVGLCVVTPVLQRLRMDVTAPYSFYYCLHKEPSFVGTLSRVVLTVFPALFSTIVCAELRPDVCCSSARVAKFLAVQQGSQN